MTEINLTYSVSVGDDAISIPETLFSAETGAILLPAGTTGQRPAGAVAGMARYNSTVSAYEVYDGTAWVQLALASKTLTAASGNSFTAPSTGINIGYISSGKPTLADASAAATGTTQLVAALEAVAGDASGVFAVAPQIITTSGLTPDATYYLSETTGEITTTAPSDPGTIVRIVGYALSATEFYFNPGTAWVEN